MTPRAATGIKAGTIAGLIVATLQTIPCIILPSRLVEPNETMWTVFRWQCSQPDFWMRKLHGFAMSFLFVFVIGFVIGFLIRGRRVAEAESRRIISSTLTPIYKLVFPTLWVGLFGFGAVAMLTGDHPGKWTFVGMWVFGTLAFAWLCFPLKQVEITPDRLRVSNLFRTIEIPFTQIAGVTENVFINTHPVWIQLKEPTSFGTKILFMPTFRFAFFSSHPIVKELRNLTERGDNPTTESSATSG